MAEPSVLVGSFDPDWTSKGTSGTLELSKNNLAHQIILQKKQQDDE